MKARLLPPASASAADPCLWHVFYFQHPQVVEYDPVPCKTCGGVLNPYSAVDFHAKIWTCPFCHTRNHFPPHYAGAFGATARAGRRLKLLLVPVWCGGRRLACSVPLPTKVYNTHPNVPEISPKHLPTHHHLPRPQASARRACRRSSSRSTAPLSTRCRAWGPPPRPPLCLSWTPRCAAGGLERGLMQLSGTCPQLLFVVGTRSALEDTTARAAGGQDGGVLPFEPVATSCLLSVQVGGDELLADVAALQLDTAIDRREPLQCCFVLRCRWLRMSCWRPRRRCSRR